MCILSYIPAGVDIPWEGLFNGACANPDGHGWAVARGDELLIGKSMDMFEAAAGYEQAMKDLPGAVSLFHSRIATAGTVNEFNVHPFYVGGRDDTVVAHNGILPSRWQPERNDARSDTQLFADTMLFVADNDRGVPSRRIGKALGNVIGTYNKLVYISVRSGHPMVRIINSHQGTFTDGVWHSNRSFENYRPSYRRPNHRLALPTERPEGSHWSDWKPAPLPERAPYVPQHRPAGTPHYGTHREYRPVGWTSPYGLPSGERSVEREPGLPGLPVGTRYPSIYDWDAEELEECIACQGRNIDNAGYCVDCTMCQDCVSPEAECDCYVPLDHTAKTGPLDDVDVWLANKEGRDLQDAEWEEWLAEQNSKQKQQGESWSEFINRQEAKRAADAEAKWAAGQVGKSPTVVEFKSAPLMIEQ